MSNNMKTVTVREFYRNESLGDRLPEGRQLVVAAGGEAGLIVSKGKSPGMTRQLAESRAIGNLKSRKLDGEEFLKGLKK